MLALRVPYFSKTLLHFDCVELLVLIQIGGMRDCAVWVYLLQMSLQVLCDVPKYHHHPLRYLGYLVEGLLEEQFLEKH